MEKREIARNKGERRKEKGSKDLGARELEGVRRNEKGERSRTCT
jgi:hypothetical protein